jgi:hypothetical protein
MKTTLAIAAAALLAGMSFAAAESPSPSPQAPTSVQQPKETGQNEERNPSGATGGSVAHPSPTMMNKSVRGPRTGQPMETGQAAERSGKGKVIGSKKMSKSHKSAKRHRAHRTTTGSSSRMEREENMPLRGHQAEERNPNGSTGGSMNHPSPQKAPRD